VSYPGRAQCPLRVIIWRQWGRAKVKYKHLIKRDVTPQVSFMMACSSKGPWRMSGFSSLALAIPNTEFKEMGLVSLYRLARYG
jgi:RNA-directed DNA polymerase